MNRLLCVVVLGCFFACFTAQGQVSLIMNGSFEENGGAIPNIATEAPLHWCDVNIPAAKFTGFVNSQWSTHDGNSLAFKSEMEEFLPGDMAGATGTFFFEQDVNNLSFDLSLSEVSGEWDPTLFIAVVLVDGVDVWDSDELALDENGVFEGTVVIDANRLTQWLDDDWHELTLGMRARKYVPIVVLEYIARWDFVKFDKYCGGLGFLPGDLNQDCFVTLADLADLASSWLDKPANPKDDLFEDAIINNLDFALFAEEWLFNTDWTKWGQGGTFQMDKLALDLDSSGEVDAGDLMILSEFWLADGTCAGIELSGDNVINFEDFASFADQWGLRDWLYYVD